MKLTKPEFAVEICKVNDSIASLCEWSEFDWNDEIGPYVIMTTIGKYVMNNWTNEKNRLEKVIMVIDKYVENGDHEIRNLIYTDFYPELLSTSNSNNQSEMLSLLGNEALKMFNEAKASFTG